MANIRLDLDSPVINGQTLTFKSPTDCSKVTGLIIYFPLDNSIVSATFQFADAHANNVGSIDLFAEGALVKVILDTDCDLAYVQNADTNAYLEGKFEEINESIKNGRKNLVIKLNGGTTEGTNKFTFNGTTPKSINITPDSIGLVSLEELVNLYIWKKYNKNPLYHEEEVTNCTISFLFPSMDSYSIYYSEAFTVSDNTVSLVNKQTITASDSSDSNLNTIRGKYVDYSNTIYYIPEDTIFSTESAGTVQNPKTNLIASKAVKITAYSKPISNIGYVVSEDINTYPSSCEQQHTDGFWYEYHKQLGE